MLKKLFIFILTFLTLAYSQTTHYYHNIDGHGDITTRDSLIVTGNSTADSLIFFFEDADTLRIESDSKIKIDAHSVTLTGDLDLNKYQAALYAYGSEFYSKASFYGLLYVPDSASIDTLEIDGLLKMGNISVLADSDDISGVDNLEVDSLNCDSMDVNWANIAKMTDGTLTINNGDIDGAGTISIYGSSQVGKALLSIWDTDYEKTGERDTATIKLYIYEDTPSLYFYDGDGKSVHMSIGGNDKMSFSGASGGYDFQTYPILCDSNIVGDGTGNISGFDSLDIDNITTQKIITGSGDLTLSPASDGNVVTSDTIEVNYLQPTDTLYVIGDFGYTGYKMEQEIMFTNFIPIGTDFTLNSSYYCYYDTADGINNASLLVYLDALKVGDRLKSLTIYGNVTNTATETTYVDVTLYSLSEGGAGTPALTAKETMATKTITSTTSSINSTITVSPVITVSSGTSYFLKIIVNSTGRSSVYITGVSATIDRK